MLLSMSPQPRFRLSMAICSARLATGIGTSNSRPSSVASEMSLRASDSKKLGGSKLPRNTVRGMPSCRLLMRPRAPRRTHCHSASASTPAFTPSVRPSAMACRTPWPIMLCTSLHTLPAPMLPA